MKKKSGSYISILVIRSNMLKKVLKYTFGVFSFILLVIIGVLLYTQTASFREFLRVKALEVTSPYFNGELAVGRIDGNLYNQIHLTDVRLSEGDSTVAYIDSLFVKYKLLDLKTKHIEIDTLFIQSLDFNLWYQDSTTMHLLYVLDKMIKKSDDTPAVFPIILDFKHIFIENANGAYQFKYGTPSVGFEQVHIGANAFFKQKHVDVKLQKLSFQSRHPDFNLMDAQIFFLKKGPLMVLDTIHLKTDQSLLFGEANYVGRDEFNIEIEGHNLNKGDLKNFLPKVPIRSIPVLNLKINAEKDELNCDVRLGKGKKHVGLKGTIYDFSKGLLKKDKTSEYNAILYFNEFVPEEWFDIKNTEAYLNGSLAVNGHDVLDYKKDLHVRARFNNSSYKNTTTDTLHFDAIQKNNLIEADVLLVYNKSFSEGHIEISDLHNRPEYTADFRSTNLDIEAIEPSVKNTVVNGHFKISGTHILSEKRKFNAKVELYDSKVYDVELDSLVLRSSLQGSDLKLDTLGFKTDGNAVLGGGMFNFRSKEFAAKANIESTQLKLFERFGVPQINYDKAMANLQVDGNRTDIRYNGQVHVFDFNFEPIQVDTIYAGFEGELMSDTIYSKGIVELKTINAASQKVDTLSVNYIFDNKHLWSSIDFSKKDTFSRVLESDLFLADTIELSLNKVNFDTPYAQFYLDDTLQNVRYYNNTLIVDNIKLRDKIDQDFRLQAKGKISTGTRASFDLGVNNLNLRLLNRFIQSSDSLRGLLSTEISMGGDPDSITMNGEYFIEDPAYGTIVLPSLQGKLKYAIDTFYVDTWLPSLDSSVYANVKLPLIIEVDTAQNFAVTVPKTFNGELALDSLQISTQDVPEYETIQAGAYFNGLVSASGTFNKPLFFGEVKLDNGFINNDKQGVYYHDMKSHFTFNENRIGIDTIYIGSDIGYFSSKGHLLFDSTIVSGKVVASDMVTDMDKFHVVQHRNYDINVSGDPYYRSDIDGVPRFGGRLLVNRSSFYLSEIIQTDDSKKNEENTPLLVVAIRESDSTYLAERVEEEEEMSPLMQQLKGRLTIDIPRGTWLKGDDMNIEISGDVDIAKTVDYFELFGDVEIIRGYYILYGRKFNIEEGVITFMGGETPDPRLEITAEYVYRGSDKEKHTLQLSVTEYLSEPNISFTLDDAAISQSDAVSIMIFGKTMDELSYDGQNGIIGSVGSNMLANMVTSSLNSTIGQRFKLDMIEVNSTENWQSAAFVVGKYITNDLFVIYQRGFGETEDDEITPETITLEYELNKVLFFRLQSGSSKSSGFDVILKFESSK
ncbi:translocation/assembly module TamB domain-containing protein [Carboxylicivirga marina]|uniref:Translocation/assembly module TamB n=1 Tax=Carboxylicivirga marina TaxID=2800988 RepID=A0ABS1HL64_9BACT|nr:translocation/assembly module TamB domain-containing protein [Carboxylicivirga marina]MBK3518412.1 translocation/assembly module TamB [Carboxylicivirga marina]